MKKTFLRSLLVLSLSFLMLLNIPYALASSGNIDSTYKYAWGENIGWTTWKSTYSEVKVCDDHLEGWVWAENVGWINLACENNDTCSTVDFGIDNDGAGNLSGYAWGENVGWIKFKTAYSQVVIDSQGYFSGYAWAENVGWIHMEDTSGNNYFKLKTSWTPVITGKFNSAAQKTDGTGKVDISIEVDDLAGDDCKALIEYTSDGTCSSGWVTTPNVTLVGPATADYNDSGGTPDVTNANAYQVGSGTNTRIITSSGSNTVQFDWDSATNVPSGDGTYCLRLTVSDDYNNQATDTITLTINNAAPSGVSPLSVDKMGYETAHLSWAIAVETNFDHYEIWYGTDLSDVQGREGTASEWDGDNDPDLNVKSTTTTRIPGLTCCGTTYYFKIWAVEDYGQETTVTYTSGATAAVKKLRFSL